MKHKKFVRFVCLMMAVLMVLGVMGRRFVYDGKRRCC